METSCISLQDHMLSVVSNLVLMGFRPVLIHFLIVSKCPLTQGAFDIVYIIWLTYECIIV